MSGIKLPARAGRLVPTGVIRGSRAECRCDCGELCWRAITSLQQAKSSGKVSACNTCLRAARRGKNAFFFLNCSVSETRVAQ